MAGKKPGSPKTGGRQKGTPNKRTQEFMDLFDAYAEQHGDPVLTLFEIQGNKDLEPSLRLRAAADLLPYRYPRMKSVEVEMVAPPAEVVVLTEAEIAEFEKEFREEFPL